MTSPDPDSTRPQPGGTVWDWPNQQVVKSGEGPGINTPPQQPQPGKKKDEK